MSKITARFGADISEVEAKMMQATRATKSYERAVNSMQGKGKSLDFSKSIDRTNSELGKAVGLLKGGALVAGVRQVFSAFRSLSASAKELGDAATEGQKSMAKWAGEFDNIKGKAAGFFSDAIGRALHFSRTWGGLRVDAVKQGDAMVESTEKAAKAQEDALDRVRKKHEAAAKAAGDHRAEIEAIAQKTRDMIGAPRTDEEKLAKARKDIAKAQEKINDLESKGVRNAVELDRLEAARLELAKAVAVETEVQHAMSVKADAERAAAVKKADEDEAKRKADFAKAEQDASEKIAEMEKRRREDAMTDEQKLQAIVLEGRIALAEAEADGTAQSKLRVEELRDKYEALKTQIEEAAKAAEGVGKTPGGIDQKLAGIGLTRGEDGKLRRGKSIISEEDAARTLADRERNAGFQSQVDKQAISTSAERDAQARKLGRMGADANTTDSLLKDIRNYLKPEKT